MTFRIALWAWKRWAAPRVIGFLCHDKVKGETTVFTPDEIQVVYRDAR